jgi:hypothetical protein
VLVFLQWGWNYLSYDRSARLITGTSGEVKAERGGRKADGSGEPAADGNSSDRG